MGGPLPAQPQHKPVPRKHREPPNLPGIKDKVRSLLSDQSPGLKIEIPALPVAQPHVGHMTEADTATLRTSFPPLANEQGKPAAPIPEGSVFSLWEKATTLAHAGHKLL